jgi:hypothetical protein
MVECNAALWSVSFIAETGLGEERGDGEDGEDEEDEEDGEDGEDG